MSLDLLIRVPIHLHKCLHGNDADNTRYVRSDAGGKFLDENKEYRAKKSCAQKEANLFEMHGRVAKITGVVIAALALLCLVAKSPVLKVLSCFVFVPLSLVSLVGGQDLSNTAINIRAICERGNQYLRYSNGKLELDIMKIGQFLQYNTLFAGTIIVNKMLEIAEAQRLKEAQKARRS